MAFCESLSGGHVVGLDDRVPGRPPTVLVEPSSTTVPGPNGEPMSLRPGPIFFIHAPQSGSDLFLGHRGNVGYLAPVDHHVLRHLNSLLI